MGPRMRNVESWAADPASKAPGQTRGVENFTVLPGIPWSANGVPIPEPRVARHELPWVSGRVNHQPCECRARQAALLGEHQAARKPSAPEPTARIRARNPAGGGGAAAWGWIPPRRETAAQSRGGSQLWSHEPRGGAGGRVALIQVTIEGSGGWVFVVVRGAPGIT
jgi:hypothetical protein